MDHPVLLGQKLRVPDGFIAQRHLKDINRHNDSLIHMQSSLFVCVYINILYADIVSFRSQNCQPGRHKA